LGYLNKHEGDAMLALVEHFSELGKIKAKKNGWSGGSYVLESATVIDINPYSMQLDVNVQERSKPPVVERVTIALGTYSVYVCFHSRKWWWWLSWQVIVCGAVCHLSFSSY
jgi:hypothetical protein